MVTSLMMTGKHSVGVNSYGKITLGKDNKISVKDVPSVRYNIPDITPDDTEYIKQMMDKFKFSVHVLEVEANNAGAIELWKKILDTGMKVAVIFRIDVTDQEVNNGAWAPEVEAWLAQFKGMRVDRIAMRDRSSMLYNVAARTLKKRLSTILGVKEKMIGICCSPLTNSEECCMSAITCRDWEAIYGGENMVVPSANHEGKNRNEHCACGCIRYTVINRDIPVDEPVKGFQKKTDKAEKEFGDAMNSPEDGRDIEEKPIIKKKKSKAVVAW